MLRRERGSRLCWASGASGPEKGGIIRRLRADWRAGDVLLCCDWTLLRLFPPLRAAWALWGTFPYQEAAYIGDPSTAFQTAMIPNDGVGLARTEFIVTNHIGIHPMALARYPHLKDQTAQKEIALRIGNEEPREFFVRRFSEGVARIAAAFYPKPVIVRTSDFKSNEYARLLGGNEFEPKKKIRCLASEGHHAITIHVMPTASRLNVQRCYVCAKRWV